MSESTRKGGAETTAETYTKAEVDQLLAEAKRENADAVANATQAATAAERERIAGILGCDAAKSRPALAHKLAFSATGYSAEQATELLEAAAEEGAMKGSQLDELMQARAPGISSDAGDESMQTSQPVRIDSSEIYQRRRESVIQ